MSARTASKKPAGGAEKPVQPTQVWLFLDEDDFMLERRARALVDRVLPAEERAFALETYDGATDTAASALELLQRVIAVLRTPPMFAARRLIWVRQAAFLDDGVISRAKTVLAAVEELAALIAQGLLPQQFLVITAAGAPAKSALVDACRRYGVVDEQEAQKPWRRDAVAEKFAAEILREFGLEAAPEIVKELVQRAGTNTRRLYQEIGKLALFLGERRRVASGDLAEIIVPDRDFFVWDLEDAVVEGRTAAALATLRRLLFQKEDPLRVANALEMRFRGLAVIREGLRDGWLSAAPARGGAAQALPPPLELLAQSDKRLQNPYLRAIRVRQAQAFSVRVLHAAYQAILEVRQRLVSSTVPPALLLETLILRLCRARGAPAAGNALAAR